MEMRVKDMHSNMKSEILEHTEKAVLYRLNEICKDIEEDNDVEEHTDEIYKLVKTVLMLQDLKSLGAK